jgi:hypothetical protein
MNQMQNKAANTNTAVPRTFPLRGDVTETSEGSHSVPLTLSPPRRVPGAPEEDTPLQREAMALLYDIRRAAREVDRLQGKWDSAPLEPR